MRKGEKRKQELLNIAYRLFIQNGYENTSVDEIIEEAGIAKGTYYYYFETKEQMLEEVIGLMIDKEKEAAEKVLDAPIPIPQKIAGIVASFRPGSGEESIEDELERPENVMMHAKVRKKLIDTAAPLLVKVVEEGMEEGVFDCDNILERVRMLLMISSDVFDEGDFTERDTEVFIDLAEKLFGAKKGTMSFITGFIGEGQDERKKGF